MKITEAGISVSDEYTCNHTEADTAVIAHAYNSKKKEVKIISIDTDVFVIILLVEHLFQQSGMNVYLQYENNQDSIIDMTKLIGSMNSDLNSDICMLIDNGHVTVPVLFAITFAIAGCDILASPKMFSHQKIIELCIRHQSILFKEDFGLHHLLINGNESGLKAYVIMAIMMYQKLYPNAVDIENMDLMGTMNLNSLIDQIRIQTIALTITKSNTIPTVECLKLRALNMSYLLQVWSNSTNLIYNPPDPSEYGWKFEEEKVHMIMDTAENLIKHKNAYNRIISQCNCKRSHCRPMSNCGCRKRGASSCSSLCRCQFCEFKDSSESSERQFSDSDESRNASDIDSQSETSDIEDSVLEDDETDFD